MPQGPRRSLGVSLVAAKWRLRPYRWAKSAVGPAWWWSRIEFTRHQMPGGTLRSRRIEVSDRQASTRYYERSLGLQPFAPLAAWADYLGGPLILATAFGVPVLSLFERERGSDRETR